MDNKLPIEIEVEETIDPLNEAIIQVNQRIDRMAEYVKKELEPRINAQPARTEFHVTTPMHSQEIGKIAEALAKANAQIDNVQKTAKSHRNNYASIGDLRDAIIEIYSSNDLSHHFFLNSDAHGKMRLTLFLVHKSGQWFQSTSFLHEDKSEIKSFHQAIGSAEAYMRRYMFRAALNIGQE